MKKVLFFLLLMTAVIGRAQTSLDQAGALKSAQMQTVLKKVYNESIDPMAQIDEALAKAKKNGKFVICQVGGNWCPWCLKFADFVEKNAAVNKMVNDHSSIFM